jgi:hypothetical protein
MARQATDTQATAAKGRSLLAAELLRRGAQEVAEIKGKGRRLLSVTNGANRRLELIVKTRTAGTWQAVFTDGDLSRVAPNTFWVFVDLQDGPKAARYCIAPDAWVRADILEHHQAYLAKHGGHRAVNDESTHHAVQPERVRKWMNRWDLIGLPT